MDNYSAEQEYNDSEQVLVEIIVLQNIRTHARFDTINTEHL